MKKKLVITAAIVVGIVTGHFAGVFESLLWFVLIGAIPGTPYSLPPLASIALIIVVAVGLLFSSFYSQLQRRKQLEHAKQAASRRAHIPRRRYSRTRAAA